MARKTIKSGENVSTVPVKRKTNGKRKAHNAKSAFQIKKENVDNMIALDWLNSPPNVTYADVVLKYYPDFTRPQATLKGWRICNSPEVKQRLASKLSKRYNTGILTFEERQQYLTDMIMGLIEPDADVKDKLGAVKILNDMDGIGRNGPTIAVQNNIDIKTEREIVESSMKSMFDELRENRENRKKVLDGEVNERTG